MNDLPESLYDESGRPIRRNKVGVSVVIKVLISLLFLFMGILIVVLFFVESGNYKRLVSGFNGDIFSLLFLIVFVIGINILKFKLSKKSSIGSKENDEFDKTSDVVSKREDGDDESMFDDDFDEKQLDADNLSDEDIDRILHENNK